MNKEYIGVVLKDENNNLLLNRVDISKEHMDVLNKLQDMRNNPNRTLLDMQSEFTRVFTKKDFFYLCLPYSYTSSYIDGISYPNTIKFDEYQVKIEEKRRKIKEEIIQRTEEAVERLLGEFKKNLKDTYYYKCERYIEGYNFARTSSVIKSQSNTVMLSTEDIGWTSYEYKANEDVVIFIHTNFGYGNSSYFFLNMRYKGIDILPYTSIVHYYKANIVDLCRHTRQYSMKRDSWNVAFNLVVEAANMAKNNPEKFINEFIVNEINEMMSGLKYIAQYPNKAIDKFIRGSNDDISNGFGYNVRHIWKTEIEDYNIYKNEMEIAFKAEKITGALLFLDKLMQLAELFPIIQDSINNLKVLNNSLCPELNAQINEIQYNIDMLNQEQEKLESLLEKLEEKILPHKKQIEKLEEGKSQYDKNEIKRKYKTENSEYSSLCSEIERIQIRINDVKTHIRKRTNFIALLKECLERIQIYVIAA